MIAGVTNFLSDPRRPINTTLKLMTTPRLGLSGPHPVIASGGPRACEQK
jgi:type IV secretion system protein VirD4